MLPVDCKSPKMEAAKFKFVLLVFVFLLSASILLPSSFSSPAIAEYTTYLSDPGNDSTLLGTAPWGEITEIGINGSRIVVKNKGPLYYGLVQSGYLFLFFDENHDNNTDLVFSYTMYYSVLTGSVEEKCYLCRPKNHSYFSGGVWNFSILRFDGRIDYDESLSQFSFELGGALKGVLRLKMASYYTYNEGSKSVKGGDLVPNSRWNLSQVILSPSQIDSVERLLNDSKLDYPSSTFSLSEPAPPEPEPAPSFYDRSIDLIFGFFSSLQSWITNNMATTVLLSIFALAAVYSVAIRIRAYINVVLVYFVIASLVYASTLQHSLLMPLLFSIALLLPLSLWYREVSDSLSSILSIQKRLVWVEVFALFSLALAVRLAFSIFSYQLPFGKTPLVYLVVLTIVLIKGNTLGIYGFKMKSLARSLLIGLAYFLVYGFPFFATIFGLAFMFTGQLALSGYNIITALIYFPFMTLCVGVGEEGLFRGFIQTRLAKAYSKNTALVVQALLFGVWQLARVLFVSPLNVIGMTVYIFQTFALGLTSGLFYKTSGNLIPLVLANGLINTVLLTTNPFEIYETDLFSSIIVGVSISVGLIVQVIFTKYLARRALVETGMNIQERS